MTITIKIYGLVKVTGAAEGCEVTRYYFATEEERNRFMELVIANYDDTEVYPFEYNQEVEV